MIHQWLFPFPLVPPLLPQRQPRPLKRMRNGWYHGIRGGKKHSTLSLLLASMSQWIFYKLSPEVHKHWAREQEKLSERQRRESRAGSWGSLSGSSLDDFLASCMHGHLLGLNLQGGGSTCFRAAVNKAASLSVFQRLELTPASICPTLWLP